jgi:hypothetical protein
MQLVIDSQSQLSLQFQLLLTVNNNCILQEI